MNEKILLLERRIEGDLETIDEIYDALGTRLVDEETSEDRLLAQGYRLHSLYNACENIFRNVAQTFENQLHDQTGWHRELLDRMRLDLTPVRPALIDDVCYRNLEELLRFRHLFRSAYGITLDPARFAMVQQKALELRRPFRANVERFLGLLRNLEE